MSESAVASLPQRYPADLQGGIVDVLTARHIESLKPREKRYEVFDTDVPGLAMRVTPKGHKSWTLFYRHHGRLRRYTIGDYPDKTLAEARRIATRERGRIVDGADPAGEKKDERATYGDTVGELYKQFKKASEKMRSWPEQRRIFENEVLPKWRHLRVKDITRRQIRELVEAKAEDAPVMANRLLARISRFFSYAIEKDWIEANPAFRIGRPGDETTRDRVLTRDELKVLWKALHETEAKDKNGKELARLSQTLNDAFIVMLLTAQRMGEVCGMRWEDVDLGSAWWTIPAESSKNLVPHRVPLNAQVLEVLKRRQETASGKHVFTNDGLSSVAARAKKAASALSKGLGFSFRAHDLRRTAASYMAEAGVDRFHIAHVLNHRSVTHSTVTAIYDRYRYDKEKRVALETWAAVLSRIAARGATDDE
jgi:integrase